MTGLAEDDALVSAAVAVAPSTDNAVQQRHAKAVERLLEVEESLVGHSLNGYAVVGDAALLR